MMLLPTASWAGCQPAGVNSWLPIKWEFWLKPNTFANFEVPAKIAHRNFFFGRLKGYFGFFLPFSGIV
jgi:hypothetical protein